MSLLDYDSLIQFTLVGLLSMAYSTLSLLPWVGVLMLKPGVLPLALILGGNLIGVGPEIGFTMTLLMLPMVLEVVVT